MMVKKSSSAFQASGSPVLLWNTWRARVRSPLAESVDRVPGIGRRRYPNA